VPLILQAFACVIVMCTVWFIPESPRFLMANGREEEAIDFLAKYHGNGHRDSRLVLLEVEEMKENIQLDGIDKRPWDCEKSIYSSTTQRW
jgi:Sugar (and other) transporter